MNEKLENAEMKPLNVPGYQQPSELSTFFAVKCTADYMYP